MSENALNSQTALNYGKYVILKVLGHGGFGITYLAEQPLLKKQYAIKEFFLKDLCARDGTGGVTTLTQGDKVDRYRKKFFKEAQILARLHHPNIVRVTDVFEENGTAYYVMEYVEGESLAEMAKRKGTLPEPDALRYISKVADALEYIHQSKVNHLDLKPANIMVRRADDEPVVIDFGVSKQYDEMENQTTSTPPGVSNGYSPIEQYKPGGVSTFSPQADIYSLGATLYKLLTGKTPPNAIDIVGDGLPPMPSTISPKVRQAIVKAMEPRKEDRPGSVKEFLQLMGDAQTDDSQTLISGGEKAVEEGSLIISSGNTPEEPREKSPSKALWWALGGIAAFIVLMVILNLPKDKPAEVPSLEEWAGVPSEEEAADYLTCPDGNHPHKIDLGLPSGTKWACCNVGADKPEAYGGYYAWGETETKPAYDWSSYIHCDGSEETCHELGSDIAGTEYDVAHVKWGGSWVMPTNEQQDELINNCTYEWTTVNGVNGKKFTGTNDGSIFLPAAGSRYGSELSNAGSYGGYWSSTQYPSDTSYAYGLDFISGGTSTGSGYRIYGQSVRPVSRN